MPTLVTQLYLLPISISLPVRCSSVGGADLRLLRRAVNLFGTFQKRLLFALF